MALCHDSNRDIAMKKNNTDICLSFWNFFLQIFDETYICYGGSMVYSRAEYPHCR